jgi:hypothetical protein
MHELDANSLRVLADYYERLATEARARADIVGSWERARTQSLTYAQTVKSTPELVSAYLAGGMELRAALIAAGAASGVPIDSVQHHWRAFLKARDDEASEARRTLVMRLARAGRSNDYIAQATGLHPGSVSRIVSRTIRPRRNPP